MKRKVILLEINEVTWDLIDPLIEKGSLPTFEHLKRNGLWGSPMSVELPPQMDPWITWTTVYTGRPQAEHNVYHLQQPPDSIKATRIWDICHEAGLKVGVYGSLCSYPPKDVGAFYVPDTFSPDIDTFPSELAPIQKLNLTYTRSARLPNDSDGIKSKIGLAGELLRLGLRPRTWALLARQLAAERVSTDTRWKRVALQPDVNFDFFARLYLKHKPDLATFHTNHVAHYQHTYWKAMDPNAFRQETSEAEKRTYGGAIEHGYRSADRLLARAMKLLGPDAVLVVASSMGQQPYRSELNEGKRIGQLKSLDKLATILGTNGDTKFLSVMSDQFNIYVENNEEKSRLSNLIGSAYVGTPENKMFHVGELEGFLTITLNHSDSFGNDADCFFENGQGETKRYRYSDLVHRTGMIKSGCHHPRGMIMFYGNGVEAGEIEDSNNLDIAPSILKLLEIPKPETMRGRSLL